jgi:5-(aminomethyl)-3-furanmethanol phosphate kinase
MPPVIAVVKVGGSLYDLPDLGIRLQRWLAAEWSSSDGVLLVPGGGPTAEVVRHLDQRHGLGEEKSHWLALRALTLNAHFLASLLPSAWVIDDVPACPRVWKENRMPILDVHEFARQDESRSGHLPHLWTVTSDTLAARVAIVANGRSLILLKSTTIAVGTDWTEAGRLGLVDGMFAEVLRQRTNLEVRTVNLRS